MDKMTLEKAKAILSTTRKSKLQRLDTDLRIARHRYKAFEGAYNGWCIILFMNIGMVLPNPEKISWIDAVSITLFSLISFITFFYKRRYEKIRMLFEDAAPQNIDEIMKLKRSSSLAPGPWPLTTQLP